MKIKTLFKIIYASFTRNFLPIYYEYLNKEWPIISSINPQKKKCILNVAFPDYSIIYYVTSFLSNDNIMLTGKFPTDIYFWSLTLYDYKGNIIHSINDTLFPNKQYKISIQNNKIYYNDSFKNIELSKSYCIIQRIYKTKTTPKVYPDYTPKILIENKKLETVSKKIRKDNSNRLEKLLYKLFNVKFGNIQPETFFKGVNIHEFFLPAKSQMSLVFPNPFATYLIAFPTKNNTMKITGKLPPNIGFKNENCRFISFMACNFKTTATDMCISHYDLPKDYTIYISFYKKDAIQHGYNPKLGHKLLLWDSKTNTFPVIIFRIVSVSKKPLGIFSMNNKNNIISGKKIKRKIKDLYPVIKCF